MVLLCLFVWFTVYVFLNILRSNIFLYLESNNGAVSEAKNTYFRGSAVLNTATSGGQYFARLPRYRFIQMLLVRPELKEPTCIYILKFFHP